MAGKIQNEDIKSVAELISAGATESSLPNDDKIFVTALGLNKSLKQAIIDEDIGGGGGGGKREHVFKINGRFNTLTIPANAQDTLYPFDVDCKITDLILVREVAGSSGTTQVTVQVKPPAGAWANICSVQPAISSAAGSEVSIKVGEVKANCTAPVLNSSPYLVAAGTLMRMNLTSVEGGTPNSLSVIVIFEEQ